VSRRSERASEQELRKTEKQAQQIVTHKAAKRERERETASVLYAVVIQSKEKRRLDEARRPQRNKTRRQADIQTYRQTYIQTDRQTGSSRTQSAAGIHTRPRRSETRVKMKTKTKLKKEKQKEMEMKRSCCC